MFRGWDAHRTELVREQGELFERSLLLRMCYKGALLPNHASRQESSLLRLDDWTNNLLIYDYTSADNRTGLTIANMEKSSTNPTLHHTNRQNLTKKRISDIQWYPIDSRIFSTGHWEGTVKIWDTENFCSVRAFDLKTRCNALAMSPLPSSHSVLMAAACNQGEIRIVDMFSNTSAQSIQICNGAGMSSGAVVNAVCWSPHDEHVLVSADSDSRVLFWDVRKPNSELQALDEWNQIQPHGVRKRMRCFAHRDGVKSVCFVRQGRGLLTCDEGGDVKLWQAAREANAFRNTYVSFPSLRSATPSAICASNRTDLLFIGDDDTIKCFDGKKGGYALANFSQHVGRVLNIALREEHHEMFTLGNDRHILRWAYDSAAATSLGRTTTTSALLATAARSAQNVPIVDDEDNWSE